MCDPSDVLDVFFSGIGEVTRQLPTVPELTGAEDAKDAARKQQAQFETDQVQAEQEKVQAAERKRMNLRSASERIAAGRASTILTGPQGVAGTGTSASRALLPN